MPGTILATEDGKAVSATNPLPVTASVTVGAVTIADGGDATLGAKADVAATTDTGTFSVVAFIKRGLQNWTTLLAKIPALGAAAKAASIPVTMASDQTAIPMSLATLPTLVAGTALIGKTGIDQTTDGTTNRVVSKISQVPGENIVGIQAGTAVIGHIIKDAVARTMTHTDPDAGTSSATALASNANRKYALIVNDSATTVYIKLGATAVLNQGIRLNANGGSYEINETNLYTGVIDCITTVAAQNLLVTEGV